MIIVNKTYIKTPDYKWTPCKFNFLLILQFSVLYINLQTFLGASLRADALSDKSWKQGRQTCDPICLLNHHFINEALMVLVRLIAAS